MGVVWSAGAATERGYLKRSRIEDEEKMEVLELLLVALLPEAALPPAFELLSRLKKEAVRLGGSVGVAAAVGAEELPPGTLLVEPESEEDEIFCEMAEKAEAAKLLALAWAFEAMLPLFGVVLLLSWLKLKEDCCCGCCGCCGVCCCCCCCDCCG